MQIGQLRAAQRQLGGMPREEQEHPAGRLIARPGDEVGALAGQLLAEADLVAALVLGVGGIEHAHLGLGDRAHFECLGHRGECTWRVLVVLGGCWGWGGALRTAGQGVRQLAVRVGVVWCLV